MRLIVSSDKLNAGTSTRRTFIVVKRGEKEALTHTQKGSCWEAGKAQREEGNEANAILCRADFLALVEASITAVLLSRVI